MYKEQIEAKDRKNFIIKNNPQTGNVEGYYDYGKAVLAREKGTTVR